MHLASRIASFVFGMSTKRPELPSPRKLVVFDARGYAHDLPRFRGSGSQGQVPS